MDWKNAFAVGFFVQLIASVVAYWMTKEIVTTNDLEIQLYSYFLTIVLLILWRTQPENKV